MAAAKQAGVKHFVLVTSIGTDDSVLNPLNLFWGILFWKKRAEEDVQRSGMTYTIVRPGGLVSDDSASGESSKKPSKSSFPMISQPPRGRGNVVMKPAGTYGIPPKMGAGSILRSKARPAAFAARVLTRHPNPAFSPPRMHQGCLPQYMQRIILDGSCRDVWTKKPIGGYFTLVKQLFIRPNILYYFRRGESDPLHNRMPACHVVRVLVDPAPQACLYM